ncbi:MAG: AAA family ATPase [Oscillospiraceae bacterium]|jgi:CO dehydrogenase maturation factor|nr:AAA family ATPase [Oscillospiraceae bacterium]
MKIAITGKGGVGKTTLASTLARIIAAQSIAGGGTGDVLCCDCDPDANLGLALGFSLAEMDALTPIAQMSALIAERTGTKGGGYGEFFKINPTVSDIPDRFAIEKNGVRLLVMGTVEKGGAGCVCPESVLLKRVVSNLVLSRDEVVILDMEAGLEHLGRGTASFVDAFIVVTEPGSRSIQTFRAVKKLAQDLGVKRVFAAGSKIRNEDDTRFLLENIGEAEYLGGISWSDGIIEADKRGISPYDADESVKNDVLRIKNKLDALLGK